MKTFATLLLLMLITLSVYSQESVVNNAIIGEWLISEIKYDHETEISFDNNIFSFKKNQKFSSKSFKDAKDVTWSLSDDAKK